MNKIDEIKEIKDERDSKRWFDENYRYWETSLTHEHKKSFENYVRGKKSLYNNEIISEYLEYFKGDLVEENNQDFENFSKKFGKKIVGLNKIISTIDNALKFSNAINHNRVEIYHQPIKQEKLAKNFIDPLTNKIHEPSFWLYKNSVINKKITSYDFITGSLSKKNLDKNHYVFYKFLVPKNTGSGYFFNRNKKREMIIERNHQYIVKNVKITQIQGKEIIEVQAEIIPLESSDL